MFVRFLLIIPFDYSFQMTDRLEIKVEDANRDNNSTKQRSPKLKFKLKSSVKVMLRLSSENDEEKCFEPNKSSSTLEPKYERLGDTNESLILQNSTE